MIRLLTYVIGAETVIVILLLFKNPFEKLGLGGVKSNGGPSAAKFAAVPFLAAVSYSLYNAYKIKKHALVLVGGVISPADEVLLGVHLLRAYLIGFSWLLLVIIDQVMLLHDRAHQSMRDIPEVKKMIEVTKREMDAMMSRHTVLNEESSDLRVQVRNLKSELEKKAKEAKAAASLRVQITHLEAELLKNVKETKAAKADALALRKQSEGMLIEYDRLLDENQSLRSQLQSIDWSLSRSGGKKNS